MGDVVALAITGQAEAECRPGLWLSGQATRPGYDWVASGCAHRADELLRPGRGAAACASL